MKHGKSDNDNPFSIAFTLHEDKFEIKNFPFNDANTMEKLKNRVLDSNIEGENHFVITYDGSATNKGIKLYYNKVINGVEYRVCEQDGKIIDKTPIENIRYGE